MLSDKEIYLGILLPLIVSLGVGGLGALLRQRWLMPLALGLGFLTGYFCLARPKLPPSDGTDWLFWAVIPASIVGVITALRGWRGSISMGAWAGAAAFLILRPISPGAMTLVLVALGFAVWGVACVATLSFTAKRAGEPWVMAALVIAIGGSAVVVLSSNLRATGVYGLGAAAAAGPLVLCIMRAPALKPVAIVAVALGGLLVGGYFYPDPGVTRLHLAVLLAAPLLPALAACIPGRHHWVRGLLAVLLVGITVAAVAGPVALAAKKAAETDPYNSYQ